MFLKLSKELRIDPPIHAECSRLSGAKTLTLVSLYTTARISFSILALMPGHIVLPPAKTILPYIYYLTSSSHLVMD